MSVIGRPESRADYAKWFLAEMFAIAPEIEASKAGTEHWPHTGWSMDSTEEVVRCSCGEILPWLDWGRTR